MHLSKGKRYSRWHCNEGKVREPRRDYPCTHFRGERQKYCKCLKFEKKKAWKRVDDVQLVLILHGESVDTICTTWCFTAIFWKVINVTNRPVYYGGCMYLCKANFWIIPDSKCPASEELYAQIILPLRKVKAQIILPLRNSLFEPAQK